MIKGCLSGQPFSFLATFWRQKDGEKIHNHTTGENRNKQHLTTLKNAVDNVMKR